MLGVFLDVVSDRVLRDEVKGSKIGSVRAGRDNSACVHATILTPRVSFVSNEMLDTFRRAGASAGAVALPRPARIPVGRLVNIDSLEQLR
jgi:hypothetical protein